MSAQQTDAKSFIGGLFDFSFTTFVTLKFLRVIYGILVVLILLGGLAFLLRALSLGGVGVVLGLIFVPLGTLLYLVFARMWMELIAVLFRIGENTSTLVALMSPGAGGPGGPPPGGAPWGGGQGGPAPQAPYTGGPGQGGPLS